jgi:hypothetical protein
MKLNTPTAIFLGLALIAVAIFFRQPSISEAQASNHVLIPLTAENDFGNACLTVKDYKKGNNWLHAIIRSYS